LQSKTRLLDSVLLFMALLGPIFHVIGFITRGLALFYTSYSRLGFIYVMLAFSAAAATSLILRRKEPLLRIVAGVALLANLGSIAYAGNIWSQDIKRALADAAMVPVESGKVGIAISPASNDPLEVAEARSVENALGDILKQSGLDPYIVVRRTYPISSEEQAERVGQRLRANIVIWKAERGHALNEERHVTVLGANEIIELDPMALMLLLSTQSTFTLQAPATSGSDVSPFVTQIIAPVAAGFGSLAVGRPLLAAAEFQSGLQVSGVPTATVRSLHNYLGTALLFAERPDLAVGEFEQAREIDPDGMAWVGTGLAAMMRRNWDTAIEAFNEAVGLDPYNALPYCGLGTVFAKQHNVSRAVSAYQQAIALKPGWGGPYALLGLAFELQANVESARKAYQTCALQAGPNASLYTLALQRADEVQRHPPTAVPTATRAPIRTSVPVPTSGIYQVQRGDTLQSIANHFGVSVDILAEINQLADPNSIRLGQTLVIPAKP
jgi:tetratricopeptide (TPR) repeat protein